MNYTIIDITYDPIVCTNQDGLPLIGTDYDDIKALGTLICQNPLVVAIDTDTINIIKNIQTAYRSNPKQLAILLEELSLLKL